MLISRLIGIIKKKYHLYVAATFLTLISIAPLYWMLISSFKPVAELFNRPPTFFPHNFTLDNYINLFKTTSFLQYISNSIYVAGLATFITVTVSTLAGYSVTRFSYRGRKAIISLSFITYMFPPILLAIPLYIFYTYLNLYDTLTSLVLAYVAFSLPFAMWLTITFFRTVPYELEEAALVDGASRLKAFFTITLPVARPGIIATAIFTFLFAWNDYLFALILTSSESKRTITVGMSYFFEAAAVDWGLLMAASSFVLLPVIILFFFSQKFLISGFGTGVIKG